MVLQLSQPWRGRESPGGTSSTSLAPQFEKKFIGGKGMLAPMRALLGGRPEYTRAGATSPRRHDDSGPSFVEDHACFANQPGAVGVDGFASVPEFPPQSSAAHVLYRVDGFCPRDRGVGRARFRPGKTDRVSAPFA